MRREKAHAFGVTVTYLFKSVEALNARLVGVFVGAHDNKFARISIFGVESCGVFSTMGMVVNDHEETFFKQFERVGDGILDWTKESILALVVLLDTVNDGKLIVELHDGTKVSTFAHFFLGGDGHGSEFLLDGGRYLLLGSSRLLLGHYGAPLGHVGNAGDDGEKSRSGKDGHGDDEEREIVRGDD